MHVRQIDVLLHLALPKAHLGQSSVAFSNAIHAASMARLIVSLYA